MSSILKALKKVEHIAPPTEGENALRRRISRSGDRRGSTSDGRLLLISAGVVVVLLGMFLAFRFFYPSQRTMHPGPEAGTGPRQETAVLEAPAPGPPDTAAGTIVPGPDTIPLAAAHGRAEAEAEAAFPAGRPGEQAVPPLLPAPSPDEPATGEPSFPARPLQHVPIDVIQDLRLEGIVWSDAPGSRYAMIDGRILKQGSIVQGVRVIRIEADHVLVQSLDGTSRRKLTVQ